MSTQVFLEREAGLAMIRSAGITSASPVDVLAYSFVTLRTGKLTLHKFRNTIFGEPVRPGFVGFVEAYRSFGCCLPHQSRKIVMMEGIRSMRYSLMTGQG